MGLSLSAVTYVIAQKGSTDPRAGINSRNIELVQEFSRWLFADQSITRNLFYHRPDSSGNLISDNIFETDLLFFSKFKNIQQIYDCITIIVPNRSTLTYLKNHAYIDHVRDGLESPNYPIIVAKDWLKMIAANQGGDPNKRNKKLRSHALRVQFRLEKVFEQKTIFGNIE